MKIVKLSILVPIYLIVILVMLLSTGLQVVFEAIAYSFKRMNERFDPVMEYIERRCRN